MKYSLFVLLAMMLALIPVSARPAEPDYTRRPVLMIHGYFPVNAGDWVTWGRFKNKLIEDGWPEEYIMNPKFRDPTGCDPEHAREIAAWVDELREKTGWDKIDIIAHSEGGLNTMYYLRYFCGVHKIRNFVGLAIAVHGTKVACVDFISCGGEEMCIPDEDKGGWRANPVLAAVNTCDETLGDIRYTSIWSAWDEIIVPQEGSIIYGARNIEMKTFAEHGLIFLVDESLGYIFDALKNKTGYNTDGPGWDCIPQCVLPEQVETAELPQVPETVEEAGEDVATPETVEESVADVVEDEGPENDGVIVVPYDPGPKTDRGQDRDEGSTGVDVVASTDEAGPDTGSTARSTGGCSSTGTPVVIAPLLMLAALFVFAIRRARGSRS